MSNVYVRGVLANLITLAILLACLFIPAGTLNYWQAWAFVAVFEVSAQALGIYFLVHDRKLVERRMNIGPLAEQRPNQKLISALFILGFVGFMVLPAFDHRFGWSPVAPVVSVKLPPAKPGAYQWGASKALATHEPPKGGYTLNFIWS